LQNRDGLVFDSLVDFGSTRYSRGQREGPNKKMEIFFSGRAVIVSLDCLLNDNRNFRV
jgi:hypothetical protein